MTNAEITQAQVDAWIDALRSGVYKQTDGNLAVTLHDPETDVPEVKHCCLGVYGVLSGAKVVSSGLEFPDGQVVNAFVSTELMSMQAQSFFSSLNDTYKQNFNQIAKYAEAISLLAYQSDEWWYDQANSKFIDGIRLALKVANGYYIN